MRILVRILLTCFVYQVIRFLMVALMIGFSSQFSNGQSINELRKLWQNDSYAFLNENRKDKLFPHLDFNRYVQMRDDEFAEYLSGTWYDYSISSGLSEGSLKHTVADPVFNLSDIVMNPPINLPYSNVIGINYSLANQVKVIPPRIIKQESDRFTAIKGMFRFYGQPISMNYDKLLVLSKINSLSKLSISEFWKSFSRANSDHLVDQLMDYRDLLGLGDWGYFQLAKAASNYIFSNSTLNADLLTWALMIRSGFDVRLAFNQDSTTVLFPSENSIYSKQFVVIGQKRFYLDREMKSQLLVTYQNPFPENVRILDLEFHKSLNFSGKLNIRKFFYTWNNRNYEFTLRCNPEVIRFYRDYPQTDPAIYFRASVTSTFKEDLLAQYYPILSRMDKAESIAFLQQFVQKKFAYSSADPIIEGSNGRFAEEVIATKSGDDRSKSVLFSWLIRILVQTPVIGVQFPGFYSVAVRIDKPLEGDFYYLNKERYYISDPTFINAPIGVSMTEFEGLTPQLLDLSSSSSQPDKATEIWKLAFKMGARRGGASQDVIIDQQGKSLIAGYFNDKDTYYPFIACFSQVNSLQWIRKFEGDGVAVAFAIAKISDDEIYIAGSFYGKIVMDNVSLESDNADIFIAQFNRNGELIWMNRAGIDSTLRDESLNYTVKIDRSGTNISTQWSNEDNRNIKTGFGNVPDIGLYFTGSCSFTPGMVPIIWSSSNPDIPGIFLKEYNLLIRNQCQTNIAGVGALMKLLHKTSTGVTGRQLQMLVSRINPSFQINNVALFKAIGQIQQLKNENGIILLRTINNKPLIFDNMKFEDGARFNYSFFGNGDLSLEMLSGCQELVRQAVFQLNSLLFDVSTGNLIVDYDHDHTIKTISLGIKSSSK